MLVTLIHIVESHIVAGVTIGTSSSSVGPIETVHSESIVEIGQNEALI